MEKTKSWEIITEIGKRIRAGWEELAVRHLLDLQIAGIPALSSFSFNSPNNLAYKTLITQELLKKGFLAGNSIYVCTEHTESLLDNYLVALDKVFAKINQCEQGLDVHTLLEQPVCHAGFQRLN
jgi:glutamate-1-semialdehyde 2,1-aminomutase